MIQAIDKWVTKHDEFELSDDEWDLLIALGALLKACGYIIHLHFTKTHFKNRFSPRLRYTGTGRSARRQICATCVLDVVQKWQAGAVDVTARLQIEWPHRAASSSWRLAVAAAWL
jgi:hypothetical protein